MKRTDNNSLYNEISWTKMSYPKSTLHELFAEQAALSPNSIATEFENKKFTYGELDKVINQMANYFLDQGLRPGQIVAVSLDRTPELLVIIYAILQCGAIYLPLDTEYPEKRIKNVISDSEASFFISRFSEVIPQNIKFIDIELLFKEINNFSSAPLKIKTSPESIAYIIYTSGSTGQPKGVQISHSNVVNFSYSMKKTMGINEKDRFLSVTSISFDPMVFDVFVSLLLGSRVVFIDRELIKDGGLLLEKIIENKITVIAGTPSLWQILLDSGWKTQLHLKAITGGEVLHKSLADRLLSKSSELWNLYGPTETTVASFVSKISKDDEIVTIGKPIDNTFAYLLDNNKMPVDFGEVGEIAIGGDGVSSGYLKQKELTDKQFIKNTFNDNAFNKLYLTGDLGKLLPNGDLQYVGRFDQQVKIRGHRIELGEIEKAIASLSNIKTTVVLVNKDFGEPRLVAYLESIGDNQDSSEVSRNLKIILPDYMIPSTFMWVDKFPITKNGKIDKEKLPKPEYIRLDSAPIFRKPRTKLEKDIEEIWKEQLRLPLIGIDDNFFEIGGTSILTQRVATSLKEHLGQPIAVTKIYQYPTIAALSEYLEEDNKSTNLSGFEKPKEDRKSSDVAIIGMAGRFPGAQSIDELWDVLREGKETTSFFKSEEIDPSISESLRNDPLYVKARGILPSAKTFDAEFFGINPKVAEAMDPQQRIFLEIAWEALESAGHLPKHYKGSIGVYAGTGTNTYFRNNIFPNKDLLDQVGAAQLEMVNEKDYISSRVSYHLNLKGPAVSIHSACSTSLLAIAQAVEAIRNGHCDTALAGGSSVTAPIFSGNLYQEGSMLSSDGHCRAFDASAKGTVFSDGAGVVLLKSLDAAQKDGDKIYGLIKGIGINNDGGNKGSFTAPSTEGQAGAIMKAIQDAQVSPDSISYVETHGTATPLGDPIEIEGLKMAFGKQSKKSFCAIGSVKSNMGHLTAAAGVAGLIKTILAMNNKLIPPSLGFEKPNPVIDFENSPFFVNSKLRNWHTDGPLRAGVSSFGVGGTNVHLVVEEYPFEQKKASPVRPLQLLMWSAKNQNSLLGYENALNDFIDASKNTALADIAYSLNVTREDFSHRSFLVTDSANDTSEKLISQKAKNIKSSIVKVVPSEMGFLFPGQGAQYLQMGKTLYDNEKVYREAVDKCAELLMEDLKLDIRDIIYPEINSSHAEELLKDTRLTQPALFVTEYALSQLWMSWGIKPTFLCGHSIGEFVAAHLAGIMNLQDVLHIVAVRGRLISELPGGAMLAVRVPVERLYELLPDTLSVAAINSNQFCVVSGTKQDIDSFNQNLDSLDVPNKILLTSHAFHSFMMDPILDSFKDELEKIKLNIPRLPIISTVTGTWLTDIEATQSIYWVNHLKNTVRFADAMDTAFELDDYILLEVGPGQTLTTLARQQAVGKVISAFPSLTFPKEDNENEYSTLLNALGELWIRGISPDWNSFYNQQQRQKVNLPSYVFDRKPCWVEPLSIIETTVIRKEVISDVPLISNASLDSIPKDNTIKKHDSRKDSVLFKISDIIKNASGISYESDAVSNTFLELGLDSLSLTQLSARLKKEFNLPITFRQLNEGLTSPSLLADYIDSNLPEENLADFVEGNEMIPSKTDASNILAETVQSESNQNQISLELIAQQIQLLNQKLGQLQNYQDTSLNGTASVDSTNAASLDSIKLHNGNGKRIKTNGALKLENPFDISKINGQQLVENNISEKKYIIMADEPPVPGSKLGRDEYGNPAWFIEDSNQKGKFVKVKLLE
ncbi:polyketide synthase [Flavobacterium aquicola]|uniref:Amino acid adenylation domain-containing protein n=1 Tax=Flavobacterium aquicola TaxID=1682742 RepID=A0A3E0EVL1_9FLAO|nr:polyketide synthase [Flavobacterium aquicola]REH01874.1 amino acid adenylation domain-containing protein [Flavobacterium aquicola]